MRERVAAPRVAVRGRWRPQAVLRLLAMTLSLAVVVGLGGCVPPGSGSSGEIVVFADSSLYTAFGQVAREVTSNHPDLHVAFTFGGSTALAERIAGSGSSSGSGSASGPAGTTNAADAVTADVFAAADARSMARVAPLTEGGPTVFARNQLVVVMPAGNPDAIASLTDLPRLKVALCAAAEPCGRAAEAVLSQAGIEVSQVTTVADSRSAVAAVRDGQARAALVYRSDGRAAAPDLATLEFDISRVTLQDCMVAVLAGGHNAAGARTFLEYLNSDRGREIMSGAGFQQPPAP